MSGSFSSASMALLSAMPFLRSLNSRYFSAMGATSLWAFAVFWYFAESVTISGDARAAFSSSYRASIWSSRSNIAIGSQLQVAGLFHRFCCKRNEIAKEFMRWEPLGNHYLAAVLFFKAHGVFEGGDGAHRLVVRRGLSGDTLQPQARGGHDGEQGFAALGREANDFIGH